MPSSRKSLDRGICVTKDAQPHGLNGPRSKVTEHDEGTDYEELFSVLLSLALLPLFALMLDGFRSCGNSGTAGLMQATRTHYVPRVKFKDDL